MGSSRQLEFPLNSYTSKSCTEINNSSDPIFLNLKILKFFVIVIKVLSVSFVHQHLNQNLPIYIFFFYLFIYLFIYLLFSKMAVLLKIVSVVVGTFVICSLITEGMIFQGDSTAWALFLLTATRCSRVPCYWGYQCKKYSSDES